MSKALVTVGSLVALVLTLVVSAVAGGTHESGTCQDELNNNVYRCQVKTDFGSEFEDCFRFTSPGVFSENFDLHIDGFGDLGCECQAEGNFKRPKFEKSDAFHCVAVSQTNFFNLAVDGEADDHRLKDVQAVNEFGNSFVISCKVDKYCSLAPTARSAGSLWSR